MLDTNHLGLPEVAVTYLSAYVRESKKNETPKKSDKKWPMNGIFTQEICVNFCYQFYIKILNKKNWKNQTDPDRNTDKCGLYTLESINNQAKKFINMDNQVKEFCPSKKEVSNFTSFFTFQVKRSHEQKFKLLDIIS